MLRASIWNALRNVGIRNNNFKVPTRVRFNRVSTQRPIACKSIMNDWPSERADCNGQVKYLTYFSHERQKCIAVIADREMSIFPRPPRLILVGRFETGTE